MSASRRSVSRDWPLTILSMRLRSVSTSRESVERTHGTDEGTIPLRNRPGSFRRRKTRRVRFDRKRSSPCGQTSAWMNEPGPIPIGPFSFEITLT